MGEINIDDNTENGYTSYGAIHWDGKEWKLQKLYYRDKDYQGNNFLMILSDIKGIVFFNNSNIWFAAGSVFHWVGTDSIVDFSYRRTSSTGLLPAINRLWGSSTSDLYGTGNSGAIIYYQNGYWNKIESGTNVNINDVWGDYNEKTNQWEILAVGGNILQNTERLILKINDNQIQQINTEGTVEYPLSSIWFKSGFKYYVSGDGIYTTTNFNKVWQNLNLPKYYGYSIRGAGFNDIVVCGGAGYLGHFNGYSWKNYLGAGLEVITGNYYSTSIKGNTIIAVGNTAEGRAIAVIGKR